VQTQISNMSQVRGGAAALAACNSFALDQRDLDAFLAQQIRGRDAGDAGTDDQHVNVEIPIQGRIFRQRDGHPQRLGGNDAHTR
jgi:hypothetical protein